MMKIPERCRAPATFINVDTQYRHPTDSKASREPLFILPGGPGADSRHFEFYRDLKNSMDLVFFDPRGCGASGKSHPNDYSLDNYIDDIEAIRIGLGLEKVSLLGKSYSGLCALGYALRYPERIAKLLLIATGPSHRFISTAKSRLREIGSEAQIKASESLWEGKFASSRQVEDYFNLMMPLYSVRNHPPQENNNEPMPPFAYEPLNRGFLTDLRTVDYELDLHRIKCPTLVLTGDNDWIFDQEYSKLMARKIPNAELVILEDAGHFLEMDVPGIYCEAITSFINRSD